MSKNSRTKTWTRNTSCLNHEPAEGNQEADAEASVIWFKACRLFTTDPALGVAMATASFCLHSGRPRVDPRRSCHPADRLDFMRRITRSQRANTILNTSLSTRPGRLLSDKTPVTVPLCYQIKASVLEGWEMKKTRVQTDEPRGQPDLISIHIQSDKGFQMMLFKCAASQVAQSPDQCWVCSNVIARLTGKY